MVILSIALVGVYPPPIGGISVHIKRLEKLLDDLGIENSVYDDSGAEKESKKDIKHLAIENMTLSDFRKSVPEKLVHVHTHSWTKRFKYVLYSKLTGKKVVLTFHSFRDQLEDHDKQTRRMIKFVLMFADRIIAVGENEKNKLIKWGARSRKVIFIPSYIKYNTQEGEVPKYIDEFTKKFKYILTANGSNLSVYNGEDLYGIDMCIDLCASIGEEYDLGFIFCLTRANKKAYFEKLKQRIVDKGVENRFLLATDKIALVPVLKKTHVFLRPTNTDSYGMSVAEAIAEKVPTIASNVCNRAEGTVLFKSRDFKDLEDKVQLVLNNYDQYQSRLADVEIKDYGHEIVKLYKDLSRNI